MAIEQIIRCDGDGCQKIKGDVNHWYSAEFRSEEAHICPRILMAETF